MNIISAVKFLKKINPWKTLYFNFHYFHFKTAFHLPVLVYWHSDLYKMKGKIIVNAPVRIGMIKLGPHGLGTQDRLFSRTMWEVDGTLVVNGKASIGRGCKISIGKDAVLTLGHNFVITGNTEIICQKEISFGDDCLLSWDILIMDTDFHHVFNEQGEKINNPRAIKIGNHVWIGCRNTILKGVRIAGNNIISANSTITRSFTDENCIIGGNGKCASVIKEHIVWRP